MCKISVVVCTHNRVRLLKDVLTSLANQTLDKSAFEVIIVDNDSNDGTRELADEFTAYHENLHYLYEPETGLSHARNTGFKNARGEYVAYIDDDARAEKDWLEVALDVIQKFRPDIFGGPYYPFFLETPPVWFLEEYESHNFGDKGQFLKKGGFLDGTNIFFLKSLLERLGGFNTTMGMKGKQMAYGEETELMVKAWDLIPDLKVYYEPRLVVHHLVPAWKMKTSWFLKRNFLSGRSHLLVYTNNRQVPKSSELFKLFFKSIGETMKAGCKLLIGLMCRDKHKYQYFQNYLIEKVFPYVYSMGSSYQMLVNMITRK